MEQIPTSNEDVRAAAAAAAITGPSRPQGVVETMHLGDLWRGLVQGTRFVESVMFTEFQTIAVVQRTKPRLRRPSPAQFKVLEQLLMGRSQKSVAIDAGRAVSSISSAAHQCLHDCAGPCRPSRAPLLLVLAVHAAYDHPIATARVEPMGPDSWLLTADRHDLRLRHRLSVAEWSVAKLLVEARTHLEIASLRQASLRTVANQLSSVFHKLGASGRAELLAKLARGEL